MVYYAILLGFCVISFTIVVYKLQRRVSKLEEEVNTIVATELDMVKQSTGWFNSIKKDFESIHGSIMAHFEDDKKFRTEINKFAIAVTKYIKGADVVDSALDKAKKGGKLD